MRRVTGSYKIGTLVGILVALFIGEKFDMLNNEEFVIVIIIGLIVGIIVCVIIRKIENVLYKSAGKLGDAIDNKISEKKNEKLKNEAVDLKSIYKNQ